jgi:hypothetical protein
MIKTLRLLVCAGTLSLAAYGFNLTNLDRLVRFGTDLISMPLHRARLNAELAFGRQLEQESAALRARAEIKQEIMKELIDGRLTLIETATRFRDIDRVLMSSRQNRLRSSRSSTSSELECYCHEIIRAAECALWEQPRAAAVVARLNAELQAATEAGVFCLLG